MNILDSAVLDLEQQISILEAGDNEKIEDLAADPNTHSEILQIIDTMGTYKARKYVAFNPNTPKHLKASLAAELTAASSHDVKTLRLLAHSDNKWIWENILNSPVCPPDLIATLTERLMPQYWRHIDNLSNPKTIAYLAQHSNTEIRKHTMDRHGYHNPDFFDFTINDNSNIELQAHVAKDRHLTPIQQKRLSQNPHPIVREGLASNIGIIPYIQLILSKDSSHRVRLELASKHTTLPYIVLALSKDPNPIVRKHAKNNISFPHLNRDDEKVGIYNQIKYYLRLLKYKTKYYILSSLLPKN